MMALPSWTDYNRLHCAIRDLETMLADWEESDDDDSDVELDWLNTLQMARYKLRQILGIWKRGGDYGVPNESAEDRP